MGSTEINGIVPEISKPHNSEKDLINRILAKPGNCEIWTSDGYSTRFEGEGRIERRRPKGSSIKLSFEKSDSSRCGGDGEGSGEWNVPSKRRGGGWKPQGHANPSVSLESQTCQPCSNTFTKNNTMTSRNSTLAGNQSVRLPTSENPTFSWSETCACRVATKYRNLEAIVQFEYMLWFLTA